MLKKWKIKGNPPGIGNQNTKRVLALTPCYSHLAQGFIWQPHGHLIPLRCAPAGHYGVRAGPDLQQSMLVRRGGKPRWSEACR